MSDLYEEMQKKMDELTSELDHPDMKLGVIKADIYFDEDDERKKHHFEVVVGEETEKYFKEMVKGD